MKTVNKNSESDGGQVKYAKVLKLTIVGLIVGCGVVQSCIALTDHEIGVESTILLGVVAVGYFFNLYHHHSLFARTRYGAYKIHLAAYIIVNGSYWLHAICLWLSNQGDLIDASWNGILLGQGIFWGLGLIVHTIGTVFTKGFEHVEV